VIELTDDDRAKLGRISARLAADADNAASQLNYEVARQSRNDERFIDNLLARDAEARGKVAVSRACLQTLTEACRDFKFYPIHDPNDAAIAEAEAALNINQKEKP
jgi:hypothetical protein